MFKNRRNRNIIPSSPEDFPQDTEPRSLRMSRPLRYFLIASEIGNAASANLTPTEPEELYIWALAWHAAASVGRSTIDADKRNPTGKEVVREVSISTALGSAALTLSWLYTRGNLPHPTLSLGVAAGMSALAGAAAYFETRRYNPPAKQEKLSPEMKEAKDAYLKWLERAKAEQEIPFEANSQAERDAFIGYFEKDAAYKLFIQRSKQFPEVFSSTLENALTWHKESQPRVIHARAGILFDTEDISEDRVVTTSSSPVRPYDILFLPKQGVANNPRIARHFQEAYSLTYGQAPLPELPDDPAIPKEVILEGVSYPLDLNRVTIKHYVADKVFKDVSSLLSKETSLDKSLSRTPDEATLKRYMYSVLPDHPLPHTHSYYQHPRALTAARAWLGRQEQLDHPLF